MPGCSRYSRRYKRFALISPGKKKRGYRLHFVGRERQREGECVGRGRGGYPHTPGVTAVSDVDAGTRPPQTWCAKEEEDVRGRCAAARETG